MLDWFGTPTRPLPGGYSGETFLVGDDDAVVLRIYRRHPERAEVDASLLRLVRGVLAVPAVLELRRATETEPAILVTERLPGVALDQVLRAAPESHHLETLAHNVGSVLGSLSGIPFLRSGSFSDATLTVSPGGLPSDLREWAQYHRDTSRLASWSTRDWLALSRLADAAQSLLDEAAVRTPARVVLAHSDFNPKNLLVDPPTGAVTGLVDWEFAHAGSIHTDVGNFTRFERDPRLIEPLIAAFVDSAPGRLTDPVTQGRATDLWALIELAGRAPGNAVSRAAAKLLHAQARSGDLTAWPWDTPRVDPADATPVS